MTTQDKPAVGPLSAGDTKQPWYLGSMNDGLFIINRPPRPSGTDAGPMMHDDGPTMEGLTDARAQAICDAHNASLAPTAPVCGGCNDCEVCVPGTVAGDRAIAADTEFLAAAAALNAPPMDIVTVYDAGRRVIFKVKGDGTVEGGENTDESALIFAQAVSHHLRSMGFAPTAPVETLGETAAGPGFTVDDLAQEIRRVDGNHDLGAGALAEALMPFLSTRQPDTGKVEAGRVEREDRTSREWADRCVAKRVAGDLLAKANRTAAKDPMRSETVAGLLEDAEALMRLSALRPQPSGETREDVEAVLDRLNNENVRYMARVGGLSPWIETFKSDILDLITPADQAKGGA